MDYNCKMDESYNGFMWTKGENNVDYNCNVIFKGELYK